MVAPFNLRSLVTSALRRIFSRSQFTKYVIQPMMNANKLVTYIPTKSGGKVKRVFFKCAKCNGMYPRAQVSVDHIQPVVGPEGFVSWDLYIQRMFCDSSGFQILCDTCHDAKTKQERDRRTQERRERKKAKNDN